MTCIAFGFRRPWFATRCGLLLLLPLALGCGPGQGKVSGRVLIGGAPLPGGSVLFRPADPKQNSVSAVLDERGNYEAELPTGEVQVSVDNRQLEPREPMPTGVPMKLLPRVQQAIEENKRKNPSPPPPAASATNPNAPGRIPGKYVPIPKKYYDISTSGLHFTVRGDQKHDIELTK